MDTKFTARAGEVDIEGKEVFRHPDFGYTIFEEVIDPANPEGPRAVAMHVPAHSLSKVWELLEPDYHERVELLSGSAILVVHRAGTDDEEWTSMPLTDED